MTLKRILLTIIGLPLAAALLIHLKIIGGVTAIILVVVGIIVSFS